MCFAAGCCYLHLFRAYNTASAEEVFNLDYIVCKFRKYPLVRKIFGYLFSKVSFDFYIPMVRPVSFNMYHVFPNEDFIKFSDVVHNMLFSKARIGGLTDNDDNIIRVNQGVAAYGILCAAALTTTISTFFSVLSHVTITSHYVSCHSPNSTEYVRINDYHLFIYLL